MEPASELETVWMMSGDSARIGATGRVGGGLLAVRAGLQVSRRGSRRQQDRDRSAERPVQVRPGGVGVVLRGSQPVVCRRSLRGLLLPEHVEQHHRVVIGGVWLGVVRHHAVAGGAFQFHGLVAEGEVADVGVVEGFAAVGVALDVIALPQAGELGALEEEFTGEVGEVGGVGVGAGQGAQPRIWVFQSWNRSREVGWRKR